MDGLVRIALRTARQQAPLLIQAHDRPPVSRFSTKGLQEYGLQLRTRMTASFHETVKTHFPAHEIVTEPTKMSQKAEFCWFIEPLCGEENFLRSLPDYCAVIGIFCDRMLLHAVVFHYLDDVEFYATKNEGAIVNKNRLRVSNTSALNRAVIAYDIQNFDANFLRFQESVQSQVLSSRCSGCVALDLARVAQGKLDACIYMGTSHEVPLIAKLLVTEAGGLSTSDSQNGEISFAGTPKIYTALESKLSAVSQKSTTTLKASQKPCANE